MLVREWHCHQLRGNGMNVGRLLRVAKLKPASKTDDAVK